MNIPRSSGVLLHPSSLPSAYGIGDLGPEAYTFVDWLATAGFRFWQFLPLGPTGYGNSPYQCHSVFAGNPYLISPQLLERDGLLAESEIQIPGPRSHGGRKSSRGVDFGKVIPWKLELLKMAKRHFDRHATPALASDFDEFRQENSEWLRSFGLFMALKDQNGGASIVNWPLDDRSYARVAATGIAEGLSEPALQWEFNQWLFFRQWRQLREYVQRRGVELIGDAPIFAAMDSADVWANPELFCLDELGLPTAVAGVPPDYFARTGQLWGNPLYSWEEHERSDYKWWIRRIRSLLQLVDFVRLDHFRGFAAYWEVPSRAPTAESGRWAPGPAGHFLDRLMMAMDATPERQSLPLIAEDLGVATPDVTRLLGAYNLPGMRVLQFGFTGFQEDNLPHSYPVNCVAYTATHDNDTSRGWFTAATQRQKQAALAYLGCTEATIVVHMMDAIWRSQSVLTIVPAQDLLNLGSEARMNHPGKAQGYWEWRLPQAALTESLALELRALNARWSRLVHA